MRTVRRILVIAGLLSGSPAFAEQPLAAGECETLQTLVDETRNDFAQVRQAPIEARKWHVSPELPGYRTCYLQKSKRIAYTCESQILPKGANTLQIRDDKLEALSQCLGPHWTKNTMFYESVVSISDVDRERSILVSADNVSPFPDYYIRVSIYRMNQVPLEPPARSVEAVRPRDYCTGLKQAVVDSDAKFAAAVQSAERHDFGSRVHWRSASQLPGWENCFVHEWNGREDCRYLTCQVGTVADQQQAGALRGRISEDIRACLGREWREARVRGTDGVLTARLVRPNSPVIEITPSKSLYTESWHVRLRVGSDAACPATRP